MYRKPQYFEHILHPGELKNYGMENTMTPLPSVAKAMELPKDPRMLIPEYEDADKTDKAIRGVLLAHQIQPGSKKKNKDLIERLARQKGYRLVFRKV